MLTEAARVLFYADVRLWPTAGVCFAAPREGDYAHPGPYRCLCSAVDWEQESGHRISGARSCDDVGALGGAS